MRAGEIIIQAMLKGDASSVKGVAAFLEGSRVKLKRDPGRAWSSADIKTVMPVAVDRVICRRCPAMAGSKGGFTSERITREELILTLRQVQVEASGNGRKKSMVVGIDNSELSKWIKRLGLKQFMKPTSPRPKSKPGTQQDAAKALELKEEKQRRKVLRATDKW